MRLSNRALNRATLQRQMLLQRAHSSVPEAVRRIVALQAQEPASPYLALWNRLADFDPAELDAAFVGGTVVKSNAVRMTLHAVHVEDYPVFREATEPSIRAARLLDPRFTASGLTVADADALVPQMLTFAAEPRTAATLAAWLDERLGGPQPAAWWGLRQYAPLLHAPTGPPWSFGRKPAYVAPAVVPVLAGPEVADVALQTEVLRYLAGFGPASAADIAVFGLVQRSRVRAALQALAPMLERLEGPNGEELFDLPGAPRPDAQTPAPPRLLGMWDNILLAYQVRDRVIPPEYRARVTRINGDVLPTLLVDGHVAGIWRAVEGGIEATAFHPLPHDIWEQLAAEAHALTAMLAERDPVVYRRYHHWWDKEPERLSRLLPGA